MVVALPHIIGPVVCPFRSCWSIQLAILEQAALAELLPRLVAEFPDHSEQTRCTDASCGWSVTPELPPLKITSPTMMRAATANPIGMSQMARRLTGDIRLGASESVSVTLPLSCPGHSGTRAVGPKWRAIGPESLGCVWSGQHRGRTRVAR